MPIDVNLLDPFPKLDARIRALIEELKNPTYRGPAMPDDPLLQYLVLEAVRQEAARIR